MESFRLKKYKVAKPHYKLCWGIALPPPTRRRIGEISERSFIEQLDKLPWLPEGFLFVAKLRL